MDVPRLLVPQTKSVYRAMDIPRFAGGTESVRQHNDEHAASSCTSQVHFIDRVVDIPCSLVPQIQRFDRVTNVPSSLVLQIHSVMILPVDTAKSCAHIADDPELCVLISDKGLTRVTSPLASGSMTELFPANW